MSLRPLGKVVDLRPGEWAPFARTFAILFLIIGGHTALETARDALFLTRLAPKMLTYVYVAVAALSLVVVPLNARFARVTGARNALVASLLLTAFGAGWFRVRPTEPALVFMLYVFGTLSATLLIGQFWVLANALFTPAQARRLFGPLAAGGVTGALAGAELASLILERAPVRTLLELSVVAYFGAALVATTLVLEPRRSPAPERPKLGAGLPALTRDPFVLRLAAMTALTVSASVVIDYVFKARVSRSIPHAALGSFFARYQLGLNAGSLLLQVVVSGPVVQRLGVLGLSLLAPALVTACGFGVVLTNSAFALTVALKGTDNALRNSLGRFSTELLWAPVENPTSARGAVDVIVTRTAQALAGAGLLVATMVIGTRSTVLAGTVCALALLGVLVASGIRRPYMEVFRRALGRGGFVHAFKPAELDLTSVELLVERLAHSRAADVLAAMNVLADRGRVRLIPALILHHNDEGVLVRALDLFGPSKRRDWLLLGERALDHPSPRVQRTAVRAFALAGADAVLRRATNHPNPAVRALARLYLTPLDDRVLRGDPLTWSIFEGDDEQHHLKRAFIDLLISHPTPQATAWLLGLGKLPALASVVTQALARIGDETSIPYLIERLNRADERAAARDGLVRLGAPALSALERVLQDSAALRATRAHAPRSIARFKNAEAARVLLAALTHEADGLVRYKVVRGLQDLAATTSLRLEPEPIMGEIARNCLEYLRLFALCHALAVQPDSGPGDPIELVKLLLEDKLEQSRDRIARLLQVVHRGNDVPTIFRALRSDDRHQRGRAVEYLDVLIRDISESSNEQATLLRLVVDDLLPDERIRRAADLVGRFDGARAALEALTHDSDGIVRELARKALDKVVKSSNDPRGAVGEVGQDLA